MYPNCRGTHRRNRLRFGLSAAVAAALAAGVALLGGAGCHQDEACCPPDWRAPYAPAGLWTETGDREVALFWIPNAEEDLDGYRIYRSEEPRGYFPRIATVDAYATGFVDRGVRNGVTYYYAIAAFDQAGNESELSPDIPSDTPRPEGSGVRLVNSELGPQDSGYDFSTRAVLDFRDLEADIYFWSSVEAGSWMIATERSEDTYTDIQDAGFVPLEEVDAAPQEGWAPTGEVPLIPGHSYVVWTWDNHFAKFRVVALSQERVLIDWAYQTAPGNVELRVPLSMEAKAARTHRHGSERRIPS